MGQYDWPENVRELRNIVERAATFAEGDTIERDDLPGDLQARLGRTSKSRTGSHVIIPGSGLKEAKEQMISEFERSYLMDLLERNNMNITKVAREAALTADMSIDCSRNTVSKKVRLRSKGALKTAQKSLSQLSGMPILPFGPLHR